MSKWLLLLLMILAWMGLGLTISISQQNQIRGHQVSPNQINRIVSMAPNLTEILFALGLDNEIVGVTISSDYPPTAKEKHKVGNFWQPNIEAIIAARPDLVVTLGFDQQINLAHRLKRMGHTCLTVRIEKIRDLFEAINTIGTAVGKQQKAHQLVSDIQTRLDNLRALVGRDQTLKVLWVIQREPLRVAGRDTFINELIEIVGGVNAIGPTIHKYPPIGAEQVIACRPDVIIEPSEQHQNTAAQLRHAMQYWGRFENVPVVTNKRIYVVPADVVSRLGPRLPSGAETVARCLRPELFEK